MTDRDPDELDLEPRDRRRIRGPARAWTRRSQKAPKPEKVAAYKGPTYSEPIYGDCAAELPAAFVPTPKKAAKPQMQCAGVPNRPPCSVMLKKHGQTKRCPPCSDLMARYRQGLAQKRRIEERKKEKANADRRP